MSKFISFSLILLSSLLLLMNDLQYSNALRNNNNNSNNSNSNTNTNTNELLNSNNHNNEVNDDHEILIVDHNNGDDNARSITSNHSNTFYSLDNSNNNNNNNNSNNNEISHTNSDDNDNNLTIIDVNNDDDDAAVDDFWDTPSTQPIPPSSSASSNSAASTIANNSPSSSSITFASSSSSRSTTPFLPPMPSILTWSSSSPASASTFASPLSSSASTLSTSTLPPPFTNIDRYSPFTNKPFMKNDRNNNKKNNGEQTFQELEAKIWKLMLHGTNMNSEELRMCNRTLIQQHFKSSSRRKVARNMKKDLEKLFNKWNYRFSIIVSATSRNTMGKALHGVWMSISLNGIHYFITATHNILDGPKINEEQMEKIEYWAHVHAIAARNMTGYRRYNRIAQKLKFDLDRFYGHGNSWSVIVVKNPLLVKAKIFEDPEYHIEFSRLNGGHFIVFRGGQTIDLESRDNGGDSRNSRINIDEPESDDNTLESETIHDDYRNNIFLMMT